MRSLRELMSVGRDGGDGDGDGGVGNGDDVDVVDGDATQNDLDE